MTRKNKTLSSNTRSLFSKHAKIILTAGNYVCKSLRNRANIHEIDNVVEFLIDVQNHNVLTMNIYIICNYEFWCNMFDEI